MLVSLYLFKSIKLGNIKKDNSDDLKDLLLFLYKKNNINQVSIAGGVAANKELRNNIDKLLCNKFNSSIS